MRIDPPVVGQVEQLEEGVRRIIAPNPSPMTYWGTNTYLVGTGSVALIDPGPDAAAHIDAIAHALEPGETVTHIMVTHSHLDHSPAAKPLSQQFSAPVLAFGDSAAGKSDIMESLGELGGGEGVDQGFAPDITLDHGQSVAGLNWSLTALHTPGHMGNHVSFAWEAQGLVFTGDHVMGWATSMVSPPDGDLTAFMASLDVLIDRPELRRYYPGHGDVVVDGPARAAEIKAHRLGRETQILEVLGETPGTPAALTERIYKDVAANLLPAAERNVLAHLIDLYQRQLVNCTGTLRQDAVFEIAK